MENSILKGEGIISEDEVNPHAPTYESEGESQYVSKHLTLSCHTILFKAKKATKNRI
jgi:hypothetical protein